MAASGLLNVLTLAAELAGTALVLQLLTGVSYLRIRYQVGGRTTLLLGVHRPEVRQTAMVIVAGQLGNPLDVRAQFTAARGALVQLLRDLHPADWAMATICPGWTVHDTATHLLHNDLRRLSRTQDRYSQGLSPTAAGDLVEFLNDANERWVRENRFLSPHLVTELLGHTGRLIKAMWDAADLDAASEGVWWAGIDPAPTWLDLARDYSEEWTHQQHIRDATRRLGLTDAVFIDPALETFARALPHVYRDAPSVPGASVLVVAVHEQGRDQSWGLLYEPTGWTLVHARPPAPIAAIAMPADTFWRLATGGIEPRQARRMARVQGDPDLVEPGLHLVAVVR
jgi:uncharacterized protein (TIGR03083 family)